MTPEVKNSLEETLAGLRSRLRILYVIYGLGYLAAYSGLVALASFFLDKSLDLPQIVRFVFLAASAAGFLAIFHRRLYYPLSRKIPENDLALAVERRFPELREKLVSAVELADGDPQASQAMVDKLRNEARESLSVLPLVKTLSGLRPGRIFALGSLLSLAVVSIFLLDPQSGSIWLQRFLGGSARWPQQTFLKLLIASHDGNLKTVETEDSIRVELIKGSDLPVRVLAEGKVPDAVTLTLNSGKIRTMLRTNETEFTHNFPAVRQPFAFYATGGDDNDGLPRVEVIPVPPPELARISVRVESPAYTALDPLESEGGAVEGIIGAMATLTIGSSKEVTRGRIRFKQTGEALDLTPTELENEFRVSFPVKQTDRYAIELFDDRGLRNPEEGSYPVVAIPDRKPEIRLFHPNRTDLDATPKGRIPIRAQLDDDFGVASAVLLYRIGNQGEEEEQTLPLYKLGRSGENEGSRKNFVDYGFEVADLRVGDRPPFEGEILYLKMRVADNAEPQANSTETTEHRIVLVSEDELERRIHDSLNRIRDSVEDLENLQRGKLDGVNDLLAVAEEEGGLPATEKSAIERLFIGQSRVTTSARTISGQLIEALETGLYNRLGREADTWIREFEKLRLGERDKLAAGGIQAADLVQAENHAAIRGLLRSYKLGELGVSNLLGKLLEMSAISLDIAHQESGAAASSLERAALSLDQGEQKNRILQARTHQSNALAGMEKLMSMLSEWDNYQTVLNQVRELLEKQKSIHTRTKRLTKDK